MNPSSLRAYLSLTKPRIVFLIGLSGVGALFAAGGTEPVTAGAFTVCLLLIAAGASAFNCYFDRHLDACMARTRDRPLPSKRISPRAALSFAVVLLGIGGLVGFLALPPRSFLYVLLGLAAYGGLYTLILKRRHWSGVVLGGSAGSFPVLAGWSAARPLTPSAWAMALFVFLWTPAHAWALEFVYRDQYDHAGIPTYPVVKTPTQTARALFVAALTTVASATLLLFVTGPFYNGVLLGASPMFLLSYVYLYRDLNPPRAAHAFFTANLYLTVLFIAWAVDGFLGHPGGVWLWTPAVAMPPMFVWVWRARPSLGSVESSLTPAGQPASRPLDLG